MFARRCGDKGRLFVVIAQTAVPPIGFFLAKLGRLLVTIYLIASVVFVVLRVLPGDPARTIAGIDADAAEVAALRAELGTDRPLGEQYLSWVSATLRLDFGSSFFHERPVIDLIRERIPLTLTLSVSAFAAALLVALPLGVLMAVRRWSMTDYFGMGFSHLAMALPEFWVAILFLLVFAAVLGWFPLFGAATPRHFVLPVVALALSRAAVLVRLVRSSMIDELDKEYVRAARAHGLPERRVRYGYALRNALLPVITVGAIQFGYLLGGSIVIEQVFSMPGLGRLLLSAIYRRDFPVVQAGVIVTAVVFTGVNFIADLLYSVANPKIRMR